MKICYVLFSLRVLGTMIVFSMHGIMETSYIIDFLNYYYYDYFRMCQVKGHLRDTLVFSHWMDKGFLVLFS